MKKTIIMILVLVAAFASCKKTPEVNLKYVDVERDLITVGMTTATVQCDYQYIAALKKAYLYYGEGTDEADMSTAEMRVVQSTLYVDLAGLKESTTYSYYYEFHNGFNSMRSAVKTFKTEGSGITITLPTVVTAEVTEITTNSAKSGGEVTNDGGAEVTERGICWSTNANPTLSDSHVAAGTGTGAFTASMSGLEANTTYHVRAYATNEKGTAYGLDREFATISGGGSGAPEGAINGLFTINANGDKVYFSQGNLQYQASTNTWRFAENQYDICDVGELQYYINEVGQGYISVSLEEYIAYLELGGGTWHYIEADVSTMYTPYSNNWIDLFGWGTSGYHDFSDPYNVFYYPYSTEFSVINETYNYSGYGPSINTSNPNIAGSNYDWGVYNPISNGGNVANIWRTLTYDEWEYLIYARNTSSGIIYAKAIVNNIGGVILLPDNWNSSYYFLSNTNQSDASYCSNVISHSSWVNDLQSHGAVFLPGAAGRSETRIHDMEIMSNSMVINDGLYWTSSYVPLNPTEHSRSARVFFFEEDPTPNFGFSLSIRDEGISVRLVQDIVPQNKTK